MAKTEEDKRNEDAERIERQRIFGENLERLRKQKNLSRKELAEAIGITETSLGAYAQGRRSPTLDKIWHLAVKLDCSVSDLIGTTPSDRTRDILNYRLGRAFELANGAGFSVYQEGEAFILISTLNREMVKTDEGVVIAPKYVVKFKSQKDFIESIEKIDIDAAKSNQSFADEFQQRLE